MRDRSDPQEELKYSRTTPTTHERNVAPVPFAHKRKSRPELTERLYCVVITVVSVAPNGPIILSSS